MKKTIAILLVMILSAGVLSAKPREKGEIRAVEFEIGGGVVFGNYMKNFVNDGGLSLFIETRYNIPELPFDIGLQASVSSYGGNNNGYDVTNRGSLITFVDYNFRYFKKIDFFAGLGVGMGMTDFKYMFGDRRNVSLDRTLVVNPRVGIELFHHLRITAEYRLMDRYYSYFGINIGVPIGGGIRK